MRIIRKTPLAKNRKLGISAFVLPVLLATVFLLPGCNMFNKPLSDFLEYWTDVAQISRHSFDGSYPETDGLTNLPAGADRVITCYVINPQNYVLTPSATFASGSLTQGSDYSIEQDASDRTVLRLTLKDSYLQSLDGTGTGISPTVSITEPNSGRNFGSYSVPLRVNSAPDKAKNAVIMTWHDGTMYKYAVLFHLPQDLNNPNSPDRDVVSMTISGFNGQYNKTFAIPASGNIDGVENTYTQNDFEPVDSGDSFVPLSGYRFVGIKTDFVVGSVVPSCTVTLRDSSGLESTTDVSTTTTKLTEIYVDPASGNDSYPGSDILPVATVGKAMEKLSGMTNTTIILVGNVDVQNTLAFTASYPNITLKGGATPVTLTYRGTGRAITVSGGKLTLGENITITDADDGAVEITGGEFVMETGSTLSGNGVFPGNTIPPVYIDGGAVCVRGGIFTMQGGTINSNEASYGGAVYVDGGSFIMSGGTIGKNDATNGGGDVYMDGGTFTMKGGTIQGQGNKKEIYSAKTFTITGKPTITNCTITLEQGAHIDVNGLNASALSSVQLNLPDDYYQKNAVLLENAGSKDICGKFDLDDPPAGVWWIGLDDNKQNGILRYINGNLSGDTVTVTTPPTDNAGLQDLVNDSADGGYKVEITGGGNINIDSTVSVPGGADVAIKPGNGNTVNINADGATTVFDVQNGGSLTLGGGGGVVNVSGDPNASPPTDDGEEISLINISSGGTVTIADNANIQNNKAGRGVAVTYGTLIMTGGSIKDNTGGYNYGSGVYVSGQNASFEMSGGEISGNTLKLNSDSLRQGAGVMVCNGATFTLSNKGKIINNTGYEGVGVCVTARSTFNMEGGEISGNYGTGTSGGVYVHGGVMNMTGGVICDNKCEMPGAGGVYIESTFNGAKDAVNAEIRDNYCSWNGSNGTGKDVYVKSGGVFEQGTVDVGVGP